jgi:nucleoside-diphosphate-sugar epimerase
MKIFLAGGSGFIGRNVIKELLAHKHEVLALARSDVSAIALATYGATPHLGDLEDLDSLSTGASQCDAVIHLAFGNVVQNFAKANGIDRNAIKAMGEAIAGTGKALVIASGTLGVAPRQLATEDTEPQKGTPLALPYESADLVNELAREKNIRGIVIRLTTLVHGPRDQNGFIPALAGLAKANKRAIYIEGVTVH